VQVLAIIRGQAARKRIEKKPGMGKSPRITMDLDRVDPLEFRDRLEADLAKSRP